MKNEGRRTFRCQEWCRRSWRMTVSTRLVNNDDMVEGVVLLSLEGGAAPGPQDVS